MRTDCRTCGAESDAPLEPGEIAYLRCLIANDRREQEFYDDEAEKLNTLDPDRLDALQLFDRTEQ
ncbi:MAG: hypothetical protein H0W63_03950 [Gemmatimonadaceae bacterium]|nr:hypothetical protein [Gemmatimonadaceae bacterium]